MFDFGGDSSGGAIFGGFGCLAWPFNALSAIAGFGFDFRLRFQQHIAKQATIRPPINANMGPRIKARLGSLSGALRDSKALARMAKPAFRERLTKRNQRLTLVITPFHLRVRRSTADHLGNAGSNPYFQSVFTAC